MVAIARNAFVFLFVLCFLCCQTTSKIMFPEELLSVFQQLDENTIKQLTKPTDTSHIQKICKRGYTKDVNGNCVEEAQMDRTVIEVIDVVKLDCKKGFKKIRGKCRKEYDDFKAKLVNV